MAADAKPGIGRNESIGVQTVRKLVGPNAILQTDQALIEMHGKPVADAIFRNAGFRKDSRHPKAMVDAATVRRLNQAIRARSTESDAQAVMHRAGELTGRYILANRIPSKAMLLLGALPGVISPHLLMMAIKRHSWTFAGTSHVTLEHGWRMATISIFDNPIAFGPCIWHEAVFRTLLAPLAGRTVLVAEGECCAHGKKCCRFNVRW